MSTIQDLERSISNYPADHVTIDIEYEPRPLRPLRKGDVVRFVVHVRNNGPLDMLGLVLLVKSQKYKGRRITMVSQTDVFGAPTNFSSDLKTAPMNILRHRSDHTRTLYLQLLDDTDDDTVPLVEALVDQWDASFNSMLRDASRKNAEGKGVKKDQIHG
ncbi:MAG: hypothetical protein H6741_32760 [Alphaproteobacteria bacterium]|nr:hypothetical protein [Alphaproteobacteria bacterium]MCB9797488.1 hypothetical protein [Alphaproteobacteria bacterium]